MRSFLLVSFLVLACVPVQAQETEIARTREATTRQPTSSAAFLAYGQALIRAGRFDEAQRAYHKAVTLERGSLRALYLEASVSFARLDYRGARNACRTLERLDAHSVWTLVCRARALLVLNRSAPAFEALAEAERVDPNNYEMLMAHGDAHRLRMDSDAAEQSYRRAATVAPSEAGPHLGLGRLYAAAGSTEPALTELRRAYELDPTWPEVQYELGRLVGGAEGRDLLARAVAGRPSWALAQAALGDAEFGLGHLDAAKASYENAIRLDAQLPQAHVGLGRTLAAMPGHDEEAKRELVRALELVPNSEIACITLATIEERNEHFEEAFDYYRRAADASPSDPTPLLAAARLALRQGRDTYAAAFLDRVLDQHGNDSQALMLYGDIMKARGDRASARTYYENARRGSGTVDTARIDAALRELDATPDPRSTRWPSAR